MVSLFFLAECGKNLTLGRNITLYNPSKIAIGSNVYIAYGCWLSATEKIVIEDEVLFGPYCVLTAGDHTAEAGSFRYGKHNNEPIKIKKGVWIGANCVILKGIEIGKGSLLAANSTLNKNIPDFQIFGGSPAKKIKDLDAQD